VAAGWTRQMSDPAGFAQLPLRLALRERSTFESFVVDDANREATLALQTAVVAGQGVIWLHGPADSGRSHLLQAACAASTSAGRRAGYLPLAAVAGAMSEQLAGWHRLDTLAIDDIDAVAGDAAAERALFSLYRELEERRALLLVAASVAPTTLPWLLADIGSRLSAAAVYRLHSLDDAGRAEVLRRRAAQRGIELPDETIAYLQRRAPRGLATLCDLLDTLDVAALAAQRRLTVPFIREVLGLD